MEKSKSQEQLDTDIGVFAINRLIDLIRKFFELFFIVLRTKFILKNRTERNSFNVNCPRIWS